MYYYSPTERGFFVSDVHKKMPNDVVEVDDQTYKNIFEALATQDKDIAVVEGKVILVDRVRTLSWGDVRVKRDKLLLATDYTDTLSFKARMGDSMYESWQEYRQELRDIPQKFADTTNIVWPTEPTV